MARSVTVAFAGTGFTLGFNLAQLFGMVSAFVKALHPHTPQQNIREIQCQSQLPAVFVG